jgi:hypothetical protein
MHHNKSETHRLYRPESPVLLEQLRSQTDSFLHRLEGHKTEGLARFSPEKLQFLRNFFGYFAETRNQRADAIDTPEYDEALAWINNPELFPYSTFSVDCIDGRVLPILVSGFIAKFGGALRLPAAQPKEFLIDQTGEPALRKDSNFARRLEDIYKKQDEGGFGDDTIVQILDSHLGCAARQNMSPGHSDKGLWVDVQQKRRMAKAMKKHVAETYPHKRILPIQLSFDPADGSLYMGLERDEIFQKHGDDESFFDDKTHLVSLATNDHILSSKTIAWNLSALSDDPNPSLKPFNQFEFYPPLDWRNNYVDSARQFWAYMTQMVNHGILEKDIIPRIQAVYKADFAQMDPHEVRTRAVILLASAFSYYLHNRNEQGILPELSGEKKNYYQYDIHKERSVTVGEGGYSPFPASQNDPSGQVMDSFAVYSKDTDSLVSNVITAVSIVQSNRREKRISDSVRMPVPVIVKELVRNEFDDDQWKRLERFDFSDLPENWVKWDRNLLDDYMTKKEGIASHSPIINVIWKLMLKMQALYNPKTDLTQSLTDGDVVVFPTIADQDRRIRKVIPFTRNGFTT